MRTTKRFLSLLLCAVMVACLLPTAAFASASTSVYVGGVELTEGKYLANGDTTATTVAPASGGYAYFSGGTLTLNNANISKMYHPDGSTVYACIFASEDLTIKLVGTNVITGESKGYNNYSIGIRMNTGYHDDSVTIDNGATDGTVGSLTVSGGSADYSRGIHCTNLIIKGGIVNAIGNTIDYPSHSYGIYSDSITISGGKVMAETTAITATRAAFSTAPTLSYPDSYRWKTASGDSWTQSGSQAYSYVSTQTYVALEALYSYNTPAAITENDVTAAVTCSPANPQPAGTSVTATVTLTGTATSAGTHSVNLTSGKASLSGTAQTATVSAGQNLTTTPVAKTFTFTVPAQNVDDLTLTHNFTPVTYSITYDANSGYGTMANGTATAGTPFTLPQCTFTAPAGQQFKEWAIGSATGTKVAAGGTHTFTADTTVYAVWEAASPTPTSPTITDPTQNKTVTAVVGSTATMSVTAQNAAGYQWYVNRNDGNGFVLIPNATSTSYTTNAVTIANDGYLYYCIVSGAAGTTSVQSPTFTLRVIVQPDIPATGDNSQPGLWIGLALLAIAGLAGSTVMSRRKRRGN